MADITLTEPLDLSDSEVHDLANEAREFPRIADLVSLTGHYHPVIVEAPVAASEVVVGIRSKAMTQEESVAASATVIVGHGVLASEAPGLTDTIVTSATRVITVVDGASVADDATPQYAVVVGESVALTAAVSAGHTIFAADHAAVSDTIGAARQTSAIVVDGATARDTPGAPRVAMGVESVALSDSVATTRQHLAVISEAPTLADTIGASRARVLTVTDAARATELANVRRDTTVSVADSVAASDGIRLPTATIPALFVNLQTGAAALWTGLPLNSLVEVDGVLYGASQDGLHTLAGDDDDGTPIEAEILWDLDDMGVRQRKRIKSVYVVAQSAGPFTVRLINEQGTFDYLTKLPRTAKATNHRAVPGRGLDSAFFRLGLLFTEPGAVDHLIVEAEATVRSL